MPKPFDPSKSANRVTDPIVEFTSAPADDSIQTVILDIDLAPSVNAHINVTWLVCALRKAMPLVNESCRGSGRSLARVAVRIVDDAEMIRLNRRFAHADHTTDVLSFNLSHWDLSGEEADSIHADIAVCADEAARRAAELGHPIERELLLYCLHGVLHCVGFDDHAEADYAAMHAEEDRILSAIGVGATFSRAAAPEASA